MNYGSEPADQVVRYTLEGAEVALKLSGLAAKNFAVFAYAVLKDQKKTKGKTRLVRMLKEQRPLKFFTVPSGQMREFAQEAKKRGLLFVPIRNKQNPGEVELVVFADDAAKVNRVMDRLNLDFVKSQAGGAAPEHPEQQAPCSDGVCPYGERPGGICSGRHGGRVQRPGQAGTGGKFYAGGTRKESVREFLAQQRRIAHLTRP